MLPHDPILEAEKIIKEVNDRAGQYTQPVLRRYPLLFSILIFFSGTAIFSGFDILIKQIDLFEQHPTYLILLGGLMLFLTGMLYKSLGKNNE